MSSTGSPPASPRQGGDDCGAVALGIEVDNTFHFLVAWLARRARGEGRERQVQPTSPSWSSPFGFFALEPSSVLRSRNFAFLRGTTFVAALVAELLILPPLLRACVRQASRGEPRCEFEVAS